MGTHRQLLVIKPTPQKTEVITMEPTGMHFPSRRHSRHHYSSGRATGMAQATTPCGPNPPYRRVSDMRFHHPTLLLTWKSIWRDAVTAHIIGTSGAWENIGAVPGWRPAPGTSTGLSLQSAAPTISDQTRLNMVPGCILTLWRISCKYPFADIVRRGAEVQARKNHPPALCGGV